MDLLEIANKRATPGVLVVDHCKKPVFLGPGLAHYLETINDSNPGVSERHAKIVLPKELSNLFDRLEEIFLQGHAAQTTDVSCQTVFIPGKKSIYCCRGFLLRGHESSPKSTFHMMVLIEKFSERYDFFLDKLKQQFDLTSRQMDIVKLLLTGAGNREIAEKLFISEDTVKSHLKRVMIRLEVSSRVGILSLICRIIDGVPHSA